MLGTKQSNGPILGVMSFLLSVALGLSVLTYYMLMAQFHLGHFFTFATVSLSTMMIPLIFGIGGAIRKERMLFFAFAGMGITILAMGLLILLLMVNGM